jgi:hypothetical protein
MTTTARVTPTGVPFDEQYRSLIAFAANPSLKIWEKTVGQPAEDVGDAINTATMLNDTWVTMAFRSLKKMEEFTVVAAYTGATRAAVRALLGVNGWITIHDPHGGTLDFVGGARRMEFSDNEVEGSDQPTITLTIQPTNQINGVETDPIYTPAAGTP